MLDLLALKNSLTNLYAAIQAKDVGAAVKHLADFVSVISTLLNGAPKFADNPETVTLLAEIDELALKIHGAAVPKAEGLFDGSKLALLFQVAQLVKELLDLLKK